MNGLDDFLAAYATDADVWWALETGEMQAMFDELLDRLHDTLHDTANEAAALQETLADCKNDLRSERERSERAESDIWALRSMLDLYPRDGVVEAVELLLKELADTKAVVSRYEENR